MPSAHFRREPSSDDIDMERIVADAEYRRTIITRLKRERLLARVAAEDDDPEGAADED